MLQIIIVCYFKGEKKWTKLEKMAKNLASGLISVHFGPKLVPKNYFHRFYLYWMLENFARYHCMLFQGKLMNLNWENGENLVSGLILAQKIFFVGFTSSRYYTLLQAITVYYFKENKWTKIEKIKINPVSGLILASFGPNLVPPKKFSWILPVLNVRHCCKLSLYAISRKTNEPNLRK